MRISTMSLSEKHYLHHCSFRSEKNQRTGDKLITLMKKSLLPAQSFFTRTSTGRPVYEPSSCQKRKSSRDLENERIRVLLERQKKSKFFLKSDLRSRSTNELQAESDKRSTQELTGIIESQRREIDHTITGCDQSRRDPLLLQAELSEQNRALREKSCVEGRWTFKKKIDWRPKHDYGAKSPNSGITEWSQLYKWLERF